MSQTDPSQMKRSQQIREMYRITREADRTFGLKLLLAFVIGAAIGAGLMWLLPGSGVFHTIFMVVGGLLGAFVFGLLYFSRKSQRAAYARIEGQPGAAMAALGMLRRGWTTTPAVAFNRNQDLVHRVVGPPGVVLIGEGDPKGVRALLATEKTKTRRVLPETPIHELIAGNGEGEVPLAKLRSTLTRLPRTLSGKEVNALDKRLKALTAARPQLPKGAIPKNMRPPKGAFRSMRGR
jgi:F0F1-type ATP synthase assembly protein I